MSTKFLFAILLLYSVSISAQSAENENDLPPETYSGSMELKVNAIAIIAKGFQAELDSKILRQPQCRHLLFYARE